MNKQVDEIRGTGRPTMKDVASKAGVALKTVSRVVNGEPGVTEATASRVLGLCVGIYMIYLGTRLIFAVIAARGRT